MNLTDDWKAEKIEKEKNYYILFKSLDLNKEENVIHVGFLDGYNDFSVQYDTYGSYLIGHDDVIEILAPCDYEELLRLNQVIDSQQQTNQAMGKKLVKFFNLLKECKEFLENDGYDVYSWSKFAETEDTLLIRINAAIGEEE